MNNFTIIIDTRENKPYLFNGRPAKTKHQALKTGDYSIVGLESKISIERKTHVDIYGTIGQERERFKKECERLSKIDRAILLIECTPSKLFRPPKRSKMNPNALIQTLISWSMKHDIHLCFAGNRAFGEALTYSFLEKYWRNNV